MRDEVPAGGRPTSRYHYRRSLDRGELLPILGVAAGAAVAVGALVFYGALLFTQRTPLLPDRQVGSGPEGESRTR